MAETGLSLSFFCCIASKSVIRRPSAIIETLWSTNPIQTKSVFPARHPCFSGFREQLNDNGWAGPHHFCASSCSQGWRVLWVFHERLAWKTGPWSWTSKAYKKVVIRKLAHHVLQCLHLSQRHWCSQWRRWTTSLLQKLFPLNRGSQVGKPTRTQAIVNRIMVHRLTTQSPIGNKISECMQNLSSVPWASEWTRYS